jgi:DNA primase
MIPKDKIEEIIDRASVVQVVGDYVQLRKRGANHVGLCPFHSEKTPSFSVNDDKKLFYCFGCHAGGNVIGFVMKMEGLDFPDAARHVAERFGIEIVETRGKGNSTLKDEVLLANSLAAKFFHEELLSRRGEAARTYFKKRGINKEIAEGFRLGYAPDSFDALKRHLEKNGISPATAEKAGLLSAKGQKTFDRFRGRITFPILDRRGRVIAFGARTLGSDEPKYLNSSDSPVFRKSESLFGLYQAREAIRREDFVLVCEGYFDQIALFRSGIQNAVATMGTALTSEHLKILKPLCGKVYALFDSDEAGKKAAVRSLEKFIAEDVPARVVALPAGKDPDEFIAMHGVEGVKKAIGAAAPIMDFFIGGLTSRCDLSTAEGKRKFYDAVLPYLKLMKNDAELAHYAGVVSKKLGLKLDVLYAAIGKGSGATKASMAASAMSRKSASTKTGLVETTLFKVLLRFPRLYNERAAEALAMITAPPLSEVARFVEKFVVSGGPVSLDEVDGIDAKGWISGTLMSDDEAFFESPEKILEDSVKKMLRRGKPKDATEEQIKKAEAAGLSDVAQAMRERATRGNVDRVD